MSGQSSFTADFIGYNSLKKAMAKADPDLRKGLEKEILSYVQPVAKRARNLIPAEPALSGWVRSGVLRNDGRSIRWDSKAARSGIRIFQGRPPRKFQTYTVARRIVQTSAAGAIFETAGKKSEGKPGSGRRFVAGLKRHGSPGRALYRAYDQEGGDSVVVRRVEQAIDQWNRKFQSQINNAGD
jgi:hypothetical protein